MIESNPETLQPRWHHLMLADGYNPGVRVATQGQSGAYVFRHRPTGRVLYVGESHTGRLWKTLLRHVQPGTRATCKKRDPKRRGGCMLFGDVREWVYKGTPADLDVAVYVGSPKDAREWEGELIERLDPLHNEAGADDDDDAPAYDDDGNEIERAPF